MTLTNAGSPVTGSDAGPPPGPLTPTVPSDPTLYPAARVCQACHPSPAPMSQPRTTVLLCARHTANLPLVNLDRDQRAAYLEQREREYGHLTVNPRTSPLPRITPPQLYWVTCDTRDFLALIHRAAA